MPAHWRKIMLALGLVETKGLVGAIEAADVMLKAADVRLLEKSLASGGLVTITIAGEVSAVQSSVEAARAAVDRLDGAVLHFLPRHFPARTANWSASCSCSPPAPRPQRKKNRRLRLPPTLRQPPTLLPQQTPLPKPPYPCQKTRQQRRPPLSSLTGKRPKP